MRSPHGPQRDALTFPPKVVAAAARLRLDVATLEVIGALAERGVEAVLLKGPAVARWLYEPAEDRRYADVDLLVEPTQTERASQALAELGFDPPAEELPRNKPRNASEFNRSDGAVVDLHRAVLGVGVDPSRAWPILLQHTELLDLSGGSVRSFDEIARTVHVALHAAQNGPAGEQSMHDLSLALAKVPHSVWTEAVRLAGQLSATPAFGTGLRLLPEGEQLALLLGIIDSRSVESQLTSASLPGPELSFAMGFEWLAGRKGLVAKLQYILTKLFPPRAWIRQQIPWAGRGGLHLAAAYFWRWIWLARNLPNGYRAWRRARKEVRS